MRDKNILKPKFLNKDTLLTSDRHFGREKVISNLYFMKDHHYSQIVIQKRNVQVEN